MVRLKCSQRSTSGEQSQVIARFAEAGVLVLALVSLSVVRLVWKQRVDSYNHSIVRMSDITLCLSQNDAVVTA